MKRRSLSALVFSLCGFRLKRKGRFTDREGKCPLCSTLARIQVNHVDRSLFCFDCEGFIPDLRNLLAKRCPDGSWHIVKIDSPRHVLRRPGIYEDALTRADWARLLPQLTPFDLANAVRQAAADVTA